MARNFDGGCFCDGKLITILSIDGGGVRGIIPGKILAFLESELKRLDRSNFVSISEYFDMVAGTSTGGLIAAMLTVPKALNSKEPLFAAKDISNFYCAHSPIIFSNENNSEVPMPLPSPHTPLSLESTRSLGGEKLAEPGLEQDGELRALLGGQKYSWLLQLIKIIKETPTLLEVIKLIPALLPQLLSPKYDGKNLHQIIRDNLGKWRLGETLTNVLITSFDIKIMQPTVFSTLRARANEMDDSLMSDVCISTSAAPTYFPPYYFKNTTLSVTKEFNVTDGAVAANNPTLLAMGEMMKESNREGSCNKCSNQALDYSRYLVLSLGTGEAKNEGKMVVEGRNWGILDWLFGPDIAPPLIESLIYASSDMVDIYTAMCFHDLTCKDNYFRIQCENLRGSEAIIDNASKENLEKLGKRGEELLEKPVSLVDLVTGSYKPVKSGITNKEALTKFAKRLSDERRRRLQKMQSCSGPYSFH